MDQLYTFESNGTPNSPNTAVLTLTEAEAREHKRTYEANGYWVEITPPLPDVETWPPGERPAGWDSNAE